MLKGIRSTGVMLCECIKMSLKNILTNRMRSFLTVLGILIGVTAVITLITTINGVSGSLTSSFTSMGAGTLNVSVSGSDLKDGLTGEELDELCGMDIIDGFTPSVSLSARVSHGGSRDTGISVSGKNSYYFSTTEDLLVRGRSLNVIDENSSSYVCWIDDEIIENFFFGVDPIGEELYISGIPFTVVGIFSSDSTSSITNMIGGSPDILIPYTTALKMNNASSVSSFTVYLSSGTDSDAASDELEAVLDEMFSYEDDCFEITTMSGIEDTMEEMLSMMTALLAGIASIALLVGGIGIMNMMLTTVTERTVEIGLKKALGALSWQIQAQFLTESFMLSMIGGIAGILLGIIISNILCTVMGTGFTISVFAIVLGAGFSAAVGIVFGWMPARKASRMNPIDALRSN